MHLMMLLMSSEFETSLSLLPLRKASLLLLIPWKLFVPTTFSTPIYIYLDPSEEKIVEEFLEAENVEGSKKIKILSIIKGMGFKDEIGGQVDSKHSIEFGVVQDADRLDAIGAIGIARCFTFGGSRSSVLHDPSIQPRSDLSKEQYIKKDKQTTVNHFHEKLLKLKDLMKTKAGQRRAEKRHKFMEDFLKEFYDEWDGRA
ncbi:hypothetical protein ACSBR2_039257 [Camellia fascicularis]